MTIITVTTPKARLDLAQRRTLAQTLTDAVLVPEVGQSAPAARAGFQVRFVELDPDSMAIGGVLLADMPKGADVLSADVAVMDAAWPQPVRTQVIANILSALAQACDLSEPPPGWWVTFRVIEEGSWGSRGGVLSILDLLASGVFTAERTAAIRAAIAGREAAR
jgi:phenylpyruvate tautomerase PptA (4-oxalocrotonate tautomerase family)